MTDKLDKMAKHKLTEQHHCRRRVANENEHADRALLCSDLIVMRWLDHKGARREEIVVLEGYSNASASMFMGLTIAEGTPVTLCGGGEEFLGMVSECSPEQNGYLVGIVFGDPSRSFSPEHLLDLSLLSYSKKA